MTVKETVRAGWPKLVTPTQITEQEIARSQDILTALRGLQTGLEEEIELLTDSPYERFFFLSLCLQKDDLKPSSLSLDEPLVSFKGPPFPVSDCGLDCLDFIEAVFLCETLLGRKEVKFDERNPPSIRQMGKILAEVDKSLTPPQKSVLAQEGTRLSDDLLKTVIRNRVIVSGERLKVTRCENCGSAYVYVMARKAAFEVDAFQSTSSTTAEEQAERAAQQAVELQFQMGCDPVPCPKCGWYQKAMTSAPKTDAKVVGYCLAGAAGILGAIAYFLVFGVPASGPYPITHSFIFKIIGSVVGYLFVLWITGLILGKLISKYRNRNAGHPGIGHVYSRRAERSRARLMTSSDEAHAPDGRKTEAIAGGPNGGFEPGTLMTDQAGDRQDEVPSHKKSGEVVAARQRVLDYLRGRWYGTPADPEFACQSLNAQGLSSIDLAEVLLVLIRERNLSANGVIEFLSQGDENNRKEALLLKRVMTLSNTFDAEPRYVMLRSGVVGDGAEIAPFRDEYDHVQALEDFCGAVARKCSERFRPVPDGPAQTTYQCTQCRTEWPTNYCPECGCTIDRTVLEHADQSDEPHEPLVDSDEPAAGDRPRPVKYWSVPIVSMERLELGIARRIRTRYRISEAQSHEIAYRFRDVVFLRRPLRNWLMAPILLLFSTIIAAMPTVWLLTWMEHEMGDLPPWLVFVVLGAISTALFLWMWYMEGRHLLMQEKARKDRGIGHKKLRLKLIPEQEWKRFRSSLR